MTLPSPATAPPPGPPYFIRIALPNQYQTEVGSQAAFVSSFQLQPGAVALHHG